MNPTAINPSRIEVRRHTDGSVQISYSIPVLTKQKGGLWFATCPLFKSLGSGKSKEDAIEDHWKDVDTFLGLHLKTKTLDRALRSFGWIKNAGNEGFEVIPRISPELLRSSHNEQRSFQGKAA